MRTFQFGPPPQPTGDLARDFANLHQWCRDLIVEIESLGRNNDRPTKDAYSIASMGTPLRSLDFASGTAQQVREVVCTMIKDDIARGRRR